MLFLEKRLLEMVAGMGSEGGLSRAGLMMLAISLLLPGFAHAATILAVPEATEIQVGDEISIELFVTLDVGESASIFEGHFSLSGSGLISVDPSGYGTTWVSAFPDGPNPAVGSVVMSLTASNNRFDHSLLGTILLTATEVGTITLELDALTFLQRDLAIAPFFEQVPILNPLGSALTEITVIPIPEPSTALLIGAGLLHLVVRRPKPHTV